MKKIILFLAMCFIMVGCQQKERLPEYEFRNINYENEIKINSNVENFNAEKLGWIRTPTAGFTSSDSTKYHVNEETIFTNKTGEKTLTLRELIEFAPDSKYRYEVTAIYKDKTKIGENIEYLIIPLDIKCFLR